MIALLPIDYFGRQLQRLTMPSDKMHALALNRRKRMHRSQARRRFIPVERLLLELAEDAFSTRNLDNGRLLEN